jgi:hypothetical protein
VSSEARELLRSSSREDASSRLGRRADRLRERLGWAPGILNAEGEKPKWMRWRTFERLTEQHDQLVAQSILALASRVGLFRSFIQQEPRQV